MKLKKRTLQSICLAAFCISAAEIANAQLVDPNFKPDGNLWGYVFGDYAVKSHSDTLSRGGGNVQYKGTTPLNSANLVSPTNPAPVNQATNAFQIRRMYLGYDYQFAPNLGAYVVLANEQNVDGNGKNTTYLKYAFVKWSNIFKNADLILGQYQTCSFASAFGTEPLWGYRSVERTILDMHNIDGSTDLGASLQGKLWAKKNSTDTLKPLFIGYTVQVGNNNSATPNASNFKKVRANLFVTCMNQKLTFGLYGDYQNQQFSPYHIYNATAKAYVSYATEAFRIGFEIFEQTNLNSDIYKVYNADTKKFDLGDTSTGRQMGWSVFASARIIPHKLNVFARYDMYTPDTKFNDNNVYTSVASGIKGVNMSSATFYTQKFITAGFDWTPNARLHIMPNIWYNAYNTMSGLTTTGPSGTGSDLSARVKSDNDLAYRVTFYFLFNQKNKVSNNGMDQ
jgi:hypothetical protein